MMALACLPNMSISETFSRADIDQYLNVFGDPPVEKKQDGTFALPMQRISELKITVCEQGQTIRCTVQEYCTIQLVVHLMKRGRVTKPLCLCADYDACRRSMAVFLLLSKKHGVDSVFYHPYAALEDFGVYSHMTGEYWSQERCALFVSESQWMEMYIDMWRRESKPGVLQSGRRDHITKDWILTLDRTDSSHGPVCDCMVMCSKTMPDPYFWSLYQTIAGKITVIGVLEDPVENLRDDTWDACISSNEITLLEYLRNDDANRLVRDMLKSNPETGMTLFYRNTQGVIDTARKTVDVLCEDENESSDDE